MSGFEPEVSRGVQPLSFNGCPLLAAYLASLHGKWIPGSLDSSSSGCRDSGGEKNHLARPSLLSVFTKRRHSRASNSDLFRPLSWGTVEVKPCLPFSVESPQALRQHILAEGNQKRVESDATRKPNRKPNTPSKMAMIRGT